MTVRLDRLESIYTYTYFELIVIIIDGVSWGMQVQVVI